MTRAILTWGRRKQEIPRPKLGHTLVAGMAYIIPGRDEMGVSPLEQFVMPSLASAYFASTVVGAIFFGETALRATGTVLTARSHTRRLYCSGVHGSLFAVRYFLAILRFKHIGLHPFPIAAGERRQAQPS